MMILLDALKKSQAFKTKYQEKKSEIKEKKTEYFEVIPKEAPPLKSDIRAKALLIFQKYAPENVNRIDELMEKWEGNETKILPALLKKYQISETDAQKLFKEAEEEAEKSKEHMETPGGEKPKEEAQTGDKRKVRKPIKETPGGESEKPIREKPGGRVASPKKTKPTLRDGDEKYGSNNLKLDEDAGEEEKKKQIKKKKIEEDKHDKHEETENDGDDQKKKIIKSSAPPQEWTVEDVTKWLQESGFDKATQSKFKRAQINGQKLSKLIDNDKQIKDIMGGSDFHRKKISSLIEALMGGKL